MSAAGRQGAAVVRIVRAAGVSAPVRPRHLAHLARKSRRARLGPHLALMLHAEIGPDRPAVRDPDRSLSYRELEREVNQLAHALAALGVGPGDRVGILLPNCAEFAVLLQTLPRLGASAVQIGSRLKAGEIEFILRNSQPRACVVHTSLAAELSTARERVGAPTSEQVIEVGPARAASQTGLPYRELVAAQPGDAPPRTARGSAGGILIYTSGTTGNPKGASRNLSQTGLQSVADLTGQIGVRCDDRHLIVCPLYHSAASAFAIILMSVGASIVILDHFEAEEVLRVIEREKVT
jgi:acyl-CoA synthetase (AMP-forming)/AMP-acid ligase II